MLLPVNSVRIASTNNYVNKGNPINSPPSFGSAKGKISIKFGMIGMITLLLTSGAKLLKAETLPEIRTICQECNGDLGDYSHLLNGYPKYNVAPKECLVQIPDSLMTNKSKKQHIEHFIRPEVLENFIKMHNAAKKQHINILINEGFRSIADQEKMVRIKKKKNERRYVAPPGHTEHHTGCPVDIGLQGMGTSSKIYQWLKKNALEFGFEETYPANQKSKNYHGKIPEPWHLRYNSSLKPES